MCVYISLYRLDECELHIFCNIVQQTKTLQILTKHHRVTAFLQK